MPDPQQRIPLYNLEVRLRALGNLDKSYVIGILDCCRQAYDEGMFPPEEIRGGRGNAVRDEEAGKGRNVFLIFGCPSDETVPAKSEIATQFFDVLERSKDNNGCLLLPDAGNIFNRWSPGRQGPISGEKILKMTKPLHFFGPNP